MPQVPVYGDRNVAPSSAPGVTAAAPQVQNVAPQQLQQVGEATQRAGAAAGNVALDMIQQVNQVRVDDALNKVRQSALDLTYNPQTGYKALQGDAALTRSDGQPLTVEYGSKLETTISELSASLGNDYQRQMFQREAAGLKTQFQGGVEQHTLQEYRSYALSTQEGTIKLGVDNAKLNWNNPNQIKAALDSVEAATYRMGSLKGQSANETTAQIKVMTSAVHVGVIDAALQNGNPEYALAYIEKHKDGMTADDLLRARGVVTKDAYQRIADSTATAAVASFRSRIAPSDERRVIEITRSAESAGNRDAVGRFIPGQGTAKGDMQVMDKTNTDPGFGVVPARGDSKEERTRVGQDYMIAMVKQYSGDLEKAWAAYNWGPGKVDAAVKEHGNNWLQHAPAETQAYVQKNVAAYAAGGGAGTKPTLLEVHDRVRESVKERFGPNPPPAVLKQALDASTQQFNDLNAAIKSKEEADTTEAMRMLEQNGGRFSDLPYSVRSRIPPDKVDQVLNFGKRVAAGDDITNPAVYQRLTNTPYLKNLTDDQFYQLKRELSQNDFQHFATQRSAAQGKNVDKIGEINTQAMNSVLANRLQTLGIDPTPKDGSPEAQRVGAIKKFATDSMLSYQKTVGKQLTDAEVEKHIDGLFAKSVNFRTSFLGFDTGSTQQRLMSMKPGDIPSATRDALLNDFKAQGISDPTDADLLGAYFRLKSMPQKPAAGRTASGKIKGLNAQ